ncbi:hypothetical protein [Pseudoalteromonas sp. T1lg10]|uniref:hypothetical protein n=1 Tax=Pseudoalteromonas sp. T1lg10 TaxID=2077093 RepID=UPI000CF72734|nr:hypothetical protein [Pseudoalteromonas sp. T1lg10]
MSKDVYITVRINDKCQPIDRGDTYEDPLDEVLQRLQLGEVTGAGTQLNAENQIEYCELDVLVSGDIDQAQRAIIDTLEGIGLPKGSKLFIDRDEFAIGNHEVLALHFDNLTLPETIYEQHDINDVLAEVETLLAHSGKRNCHSSTHHETIVYYGGPCFTTMEQRILDYVRQHPLCQNGRITQAA